MEVISEINSIMECMDSTFEEYNTTQILSASAPPLPDDSEEDDILPADKLVVPFLPSEDEILASCAPLITSVKIVIENNDPLLLHLKIFNHYPIVVDFDRTSSGTMGQIQASGLVQLEDSLVSCNGVSLRNIPLDQVAQLLRPPSHPVSTRILEFQRIPLCALPPPTSVTSPASRNSYFQREYDAILKSPLLDDIRIRNLCMRGIPDEKRPIYWRILLGYLPKQTDRWESYLSKQRQLYHEISANLRIDSLLSTPRTADNNVANDDISVLHSIQVDVARTHPSLQFFIRDEQGAVGMLANPTLCLTRILFVYAKYNFGVRYTQGMNEICAALFYVFATDKDDCWREHAEADTYFCFMALMSELRDLFLENMDDTSYGIQGRLAQLNAVLRKSDAALYDHLQGQGVDTSFFALRWITTLFSREFDLPDTMRLWDSLFSDMQMLDFVSFISATMVLEQREFFIEHDFAANLSLLQKYPPIDVVYLLQKAAELQDRDARKSNAELFTELIDAAKLNGKEVLEDSMKMLSTSAGNFKKLFAKQMRRTSTQFDGLRTNYYRDKGKPSSQLTSDEV